MNRFIAVAIVIMTLTACGNSVKTPDKTAVVAKTDTAISVPVNHSQVDPVCGMMRDGTWTDYTIYQGDSIWFCSSAEMQAFIANPKKYVKN